jgi:hypothetical protein
MARAVLANPLANGHARDPQAGLKSHSYAMGAAGIEPATSRV